MTNRILLMLLAISLLTHCRKQYNPPIEKTAQAATGMVSAAHPLATRAGQLMLQQGGNAADAAVATAFALSVVEPSMSGLGGRQQIILRLPDGSVRGIDATSQAPAAYDTAQVTNNNRYGYHVIGIPGVVAGLTRLLDEYGTLPLKTVMAPAIQYAEKGFRMLPMQARRHELAADQLKLFSGSSQHYLEEDSTAYDEGDLLVQKDLAKTLRIISDGGHKAFYTGPIAQKIVADMQANGGLITLEDLANYQALDAKIVEGTYRDEYELYGLWMPSYGAITIGILQTLERFPLSEMRGADWAAAHHQAIALAYEHRRRQRQDDSIALRLTSQEFADSLAALITLQPGDNQPMGMRRDVPESWKAEMGHTTHLSTADSSGMMIALTQSLGPNFGSKVVTPELGFVYAVTLGRYLGIYKAGQRASSHISPFIITKEGRPFMVLGAAGGSRIVSAITSVTSRVIDHQMPISEALAAPRVHPVEDSIYLENHPGEGWKDEVVEALEERGYRLKELDDVARFGRVHAIYYDAKTGQWIGAADPDWEGSAAGQ